MSSPSTAAPISLPTWDAELDDLLCNSQTIAQIRRVVTRPLVPFRSSLYASESLETIDEETEAALSQSLSAVPVAAVVACGSSRRPGQKASRRLGFLECWKLFKKAFTY